MATAHKSLFTPAQAAEFLSVSVETLAQWRSQQRGPNYIKLEARLVRYPVSELESYLEERIVQTRN